MAADPLDVIDITEAKDELGISVPDGDIDAAVQLYVTAISRRLVDLCGPIVKQTITGEVHDGNGNALWLMQRPVVSVTTITEYQGPTATVLVPENRASLTTADYILYSSDGMIVRRDGGTDRPFWAGRSNVVVTYVAGRFETTDDVDQRFKQAARITFAHNWRPNRGGSSEVFGGALLATGVTSCAVPQTAKEILGYEMLNVGAGIA